MLPGNDGILANVNHQESVDFSIENVATKRKRESENRIDPEIEIRDGCLFYGVEYVEPSENESV